MAEGLFEVLSTDLGGRLGRLRTKRGSILTPTLLPVVHPFRQELPIKVIEDLGYEALMTNAYLALKHYGDEAERKGIHALLGFDGVIMTDSGGYQVLRYGEVKVTSQEIVRFQEAIGSDIAVILDQPTGFKVSKGRAKATVEATLRAAEEAKTLAKGSSLWTGAIQGGPYPDLVAYCAEKMNRLDFDLYALGSPTEVMESYELDRLIPMILAARRRLEPKKPLHIFGGGHPLTIPLLVALGGDLFDSASYMLYAKDGRYMTDMGTQRVEDLRHLACPCPTCSKRGAGELRELPRQEMVPALALHNLFVLKQEVKRTQKAIAEGRLWEYLGYRARAHPALEKAFKLLAKRSCELEEGTPLFKPRALYLHSPPDELRPEVLRYHRRLKDLRLPKALQGKTLALVGRARGGSPFRDDGLLHKIKEWREAGGGPVCALLPPFGLVPLELSELYPLSQHLVGESLNLSKSGAEASREFLKRNEIRKIVVIDPNLKMSVVKRLARGLCEVSMEIGE